MEYLVKEIRKPLIKPPHLKKGDKVGLVSPASRIASPLRLNRCVQIIEELGFKAEIGRHVLKTKGFMAGSDEERAEDLNRFFENNEIKAIFCLTGGYGSLHLLDLLDYGSLEANPKLFIGCDDNSALLNVIHKNTGLVTLHAANLDDINDKDTFDNIHAALFCTKNLPNIYCKGKQDDFLSQSNIFHSTTGSTTDNSVVEGIVTGGNLTTLTSLFGTKHKPIYSDALLLLEDRNEQFGILDRWFTNLYLTGTLAEVSGIAFGAFPKCDTRGSDNMLSIIDTFGDRLSQIQRPGCFGFQFGQAPGCFPFPIGIQAQMDCQRGILEFKEPYLSK